VVLWKADECYGVENGRLLASFGVYGGKEIS
jgi:hypothetical protein